jgi:hypothetical protein
MKVKESVKGMNILCKFLTYGRLGYESITLKIISAFIVNNEFTHASYSYNE